MSDKYRESPLASTTLVSRNFPFTFTIGNSKTISVNNTSNVIQTNLEKLNLNELDNLIHSQKSLEFPVSSSNDDEINKARNRRSLVDPLNSSLISRPHHKHRYETILYKELSSLGLKKDRLEKALAATAYTNSIDAINWLMKHSKDPFVNNETIASTRDCLLALCPIGQLQSQISNFFQQVKQKIGCNEAHYNNLLPFMKLTPFFKLPDNQMANLHKAFDKTFKSTINNESFSEPALFTLNKQTKLNEINIDLHISPQMILLYPDIESENTLKQIVGNFSKAAIKYTNYEIIPYSKQLHLTLGYGYDPEHKKVLEEIANRCINYRQQSEWEIRLYSRDSRADAKMTYRVIASNKPKLDNELYIKENDLVYATGSIKDNLMKGVSFTTGETGYFPVKNVERVAESETWKLHKSHLLVGNSTSSSSTNLAKQQQAQIQSSITNGSTSQTNGQFINSLDRSASLQRSDTRINLNSFYYSENPSMQKRFQLFPHRSMQSQGTLRFFFSRHGERIDLAFGPQWIDQAFDRSGKYKRVNLNMPTDLPYRQSKREFLGDSPLTEIGQFQARLTGEALGYEGYKIHYCYSSPALRCIQTATQILAAQGLDKIVKIRIEPSVFEFLGWYDKGLPTFLSHESLVAFGYNIDVNYKPLLTLERLQQDENYTDYYQRSFNITKYLSNIHQNEGANILVVGHAGTLEVCTRQITGMPVRPYSEFNATIRKVPYLGLAMLEKEAGNNSFEIQGPVIPALGHTANFNFDPMGLKL